MFALESGSTGVQRNTKPTLVGTVTAYLLPPPSQPGYDHNNVSRTKTFYCRNLTNIYAFLNPQKIFSGIHILTAEIGMEEVY